MARRDGLYKRGRIWWMRTDPRTGKQGSTGLANREDAKRFRDDLRKVFSSPSGADTATLGEWINRYVMAREADGLSSDFARQKLGAWLSVFERDTLLSEFAKPETADDYVVLRRAAGITDHTLTKEFGQLRKVLKHAKRYNAFNGDPSTLQPVTLTKNYVARKRALTPVEVDRLISECSPSLSAFVARCVAYSCRMSEAYVTEFLDDTGRAHVHGTKTPRSDRVVPLLPPFRRLGILARLTPHGPNNVRRDLLAACSRAKIEPATPNDLRRTFDTTLSEAGLPHSLIAAFMGHAGTAMTAGVYDWARFSELERRAVETLQNRYSGQEAKYATPDSNRGPSAPEAKSDSPDDQGDRETPDAKSTRRATEHALNSATNATLTLHRPPAQWALADAAFRMGVLTGRAA